MKLRMVPSILALTAATAACAITTPAAADPYSSHRGAEADTSPNADLIASGLFTLALPYMASVVVATESTRQGDYYLYTPVAGPWMDLAHRDPCPPVGTCANESAYQILLVANGVLQGFGALEILSGFMFPVTTPSKTASTKKAPATTATVHVAPTVGNSNAGLAAFGTF
jgi:hypothetical protein